MALASKYSWARKEDGWGILVNPKGRIFVVSSDLVGAIEGQNLEEEAEDYLSHIGMLDKLPTCKIDFSRFELQEINYPEDATKLSAPIQVLVELTRKCNLNCPHCYVRGGKPRLNELQTHEWFTVLDEFKRMKIPFVSFTGGEPLLRDDIFKILNYADKLGFHFQISTNGLLLNEKNAEEIPPATHISISLDGWGKSNDFIRGEGSFKKILTNIDILKRKGFEPTIYYTLMKTNLKDTAKFLRYCIRKKLLPAIFVVNEVGRCEDNKYLLLDENDVRSFFNILRLYDTAYDLLEARSFLERFWQSLLHTRMLFPLVLRRHYKPKSRAQYGFYLSQFNGLVHHIFGGCRGARCIAYVSSEGNVFPCSNCASYGIFGGGNVRLNSFEEIWKRAYVLEDFRKILWGVFEGCKTCDISDVCTFRCAQRSMRRYGNPRICGATPFTMELFRQARKWNLTSQISPE